MPRTRSQPISPGGFKSLEDVPRKRRSAKPTANNAENTDTRATTVASASTDNPARRVTKTTTRSSTSSTNKRAPKKRTRSTRSREPKDDQPNTEQPNTEEQTKPQGSEPTSQSPSITPAIAESTATPAAKSEHQISSSQNVNFSSSRKRDSVSPVNLPRTPSPRHSNKRLDNQPHGVLDVSQETVVTPPKEGPVAPAAEDLNSQSQITPPKGRHSSCTSLHLSSQQPQVTFPSTTSQTTQESSSVSTGLVAVSSTTQSCFQRPDPAAQLSSELRHHVSKPGVVNTTARSQEPVPQPRAPPQAVSGNTGSASITAHPQVRVQQSESSIQDSSQNTHPSAVFGANASSMPSSSAQPRFIRQRTPVFITPEGSPQPLRRESRPSRFRSGPSPLLRMAVLTRAQRYIDTSADSIQHESAPQSAFPSDNAERAQNSNTRVLSSVSSAPSIPVQPAVSTTPPGEPPNASAAIIPPGSTISASPLQQSTNTSTVTGVQTTSPRAFTRSSSGDPMEIDTSPRTGCMATQTSPSLILEYGPACPCCSAILRCPNGHPVWSQSQVRQFTRSIPLTQPNTAAPPVDREESKTQDTSDKRNPVTPRINRKRSRPQDMSENDAELRSAKRRELSAATIANHRNRQIVPYSQRRSRKLAEKKTVIGTALFTIPESPGTSESPKSPETPSVIKVLRHPASIARDNKTETADTEPRTPEAQQTRGWGIRGLLSSVPRSISRLITSFGETTENAEPITPPTPEAVRNAELSSSPTSEVVRNAELPSSPTSEVVRNAELSMPPTSKAVRNSESITPRTAALVDETEPTTPTTPPPVSGIQVVPNPMILTPYVPSPVTNPTSVTIAPSMKPRQELIEPRHPETRSPLPNLSHSLSPRPLDLGPRKDEVASCEEPVISLPAANSRDKGVAKPKKRKRSPSPEVIPNPPGVSYGMDLKYFCYSSESEEEEEELPLSEPPKPQPPSPQGILRARKRVRFDVSPQDTPSKLRLQRTTATADIATPSGTTITRSCLSREVELAELTEPSPGILPASHGSAVLSPSVGSPPTRKPSPPVTYKLDYDLFSSDDDDVEEEEVSPAKAEVLADTSVLRWPGANPYSPAFGSRIRGAPGPGQFGREFDRLRGTLVI
ncbi:hypothetical protein PRK78_000425 [Emydomyces testavorans]|uniref:Uncharacterized protein n=1 Tax=Emydomyces testavorans TaxID=2070801 RepID=A0AAF0DB21_9EURO|nr:hypothetical protein PRK78_000425 [Emydomyces testavorans]